MFLFCWLGRDALPLCVLDAREKLRFAMRDLGKIFDWGLGERNNPPECSRLLLTSRNRKRISRRVRLPSSILIVLFCRAEQRGSLYSPLMNASVGPQNKKRLVNALPLQKGTRACSIIISCAIAVHAMQQRQQNRPGRTEPVLFLLYYLHTESFTCL